MRRDTWWSRYLPTKAECSISSRESALSLEEMDHSAFVGKYLDLHVSRRIEQFLGVDVSVPEVELRLPRGPLQSLLGCPGFGHLPGALSAPACIRLDQDGSKVAQELLQFNGVPYRLVRPGYCRDAVLPRDPP